MVFNGNQALKYKHERLVKKWYRNEQFVNFILFGYQDKKF